MSEYNYDLNAIPKLTRKDIREQMKNVSDETARYLVDYYYIAQDDRIRFNNQTRTMKSSGEAVDLIHALAVQSENIEKIVAKALDDYSINHKMGPWMRNIFGIGPVISAGILAHIDINKAPTAGHIWSFAGLDPTKVWEKGEKRPFNASLKLLCWKIGQSFMKFSNNEKCFYGKLYRERKQLEIQRNMSGHNRELAAKILATKKWKDNVTSQALKEGRLSDGHIDARARRYAVKIFLSHLQAEWYRTEFGKEPPMPFAIAILGHAHMIEPGK